MTLIRVSVVIYGLSAFAFGFGISNICAYLRSAMPQHPSGRCLGCLQPYDDCDNPITHAVRR
jgi:hypothetical protein